MSPRVQEMEVKKADFHCYCGKVNLAKKVETLYIYTYTLTAFEGFTLSCAYSSVKWM